MKTVLRSLVVLLVSIGAWSVASAGNAPCNSVSELYCSMTYLMSDGSTLVGPSDNEVAQDLNPEPFDPPDCEISDVLFSYVGKFVVNYIPQSNSMTAWLDFNNSEKSLGRDVSPDSNGYYSFTIPAADMDLDHSMISAQVSCKMHN